MQGEREITARAGSGRSITSLGGATLLLIVALLWSSAPFLTPAVLSGETFLFRDNSYALFTAGQLLEGKLLFRDVFYQYGPLPAYLHAAWAGIFGNQIIPYWHLAQVLSVIGVLQLWALLRRACPPWQAVLFGVVVMFPYFLLPGSIVGGVGGSLYVGLERICLLGIALFWKEPRGRTFRSAFFIGLILGAMQWIKFGGAFVAGASLLGVDLLFLLSQSPSKDLWTRWLRVSLATFLGFLLVEGLGVSAAFALLHAPLAVDVIWPLWMVESYEGYRDRSVPLFHWFNRNFFFGRQLLIVAALALCAWCGGRFLWKRWHAEEQGASSPQLAGAALFLSIYFALAILLYLPHMWVAMPYVWTALLPVALFLGRGSYLAKGAFYFVCLPSFFLSLKELARPPLEPGLRAEQLRNDTLWLTAETVDRMAKLDRLLDRLRQEDLNRGQLRDAILGYPFGSGFHHFLGHPPATRHAWFLPGFVRPWEEKRLLQSLDRTFAVVVYFFDAQARAPSADPCNWEAYSIPILTKDACRAFADHLQPPVEVDSHCWVFPVAPQPASAGAMERLTYAISQRPMSLAK